MRTACTDMVLSSDKQHSHVYLCYPSEKSCNCNFLTSEHKGHMICNWLLMDLETNIFISCHTKQDHGAFLRTALNCWRHSYSSLSTPSVSHPRFWCVGPTKGIGQWSPSPSFPSSPSEWRCTTFRHWGCEPRRGGSRRRWRTDGVIANHDPVRLPSPKQLHASSFTRWWQSVSSSVSIVGWY